MATIIGIRNHDQNIAMPFERVPATPASHFQAALHAAIAVVWEQVARSCQGAQPALEEFPFLRGYVEQIAASDRRDDNVSSRWMTALRRWEDQADAHLPIRALREDALLDDSEITLLLATGLPDEDPSFGALFEVAQARPGVRRPTAGLIHAWWRYAFGDGSGRRAARRLVELGLLQAIDTAGVPSDPAYHVPAPIWDAIRGETAEALSPHARLAADINVPNIEDLILPAGVAEQLERACALLASGELNALAVRGPRRNGRETVLRAVARRLGRVPLVVEGEAGSDFDSFALGSLATLLHAFPVIRYDLGAGERARLPTLSGYRGPLGIVIGPYGGLEGDHFERLSTIQLDLPDLATRAAHLAAATDPATSVDVNDAARWLRLTSGNLRRVASLAPSLAHLEGRANVTRADLRRASSTLNRHALDTLATWLPPCGGLEQLAVRADTSLELDHLIRRCRYRDDLYASLGPAFSAQRSYGVRSMFAGPSGTGKTFAARLIAAELDIDLYRIDLSAVVDKYIGETEKNLEALFAHAEELDVMLLLDEGDALLGERSAVNSATDRYANLETNYLLQRLETFDGIIIVTTNATDRIDRAFERRMDVVVTFQPPEANERLAIWRSHLPPDGRVRETTLETIASLYRLTGGQIRNAALHAGLLAIDDGGRIHVDHLEAAIEREYRKLGKVAPAIDPRDLPAGMRDG